MIILVGEADRDRILRHQLGRVQSLGAEQMLGGPPETGDIGVLVDFVLLPLAKIN